MWTSASRGTSTGRRRWRRPSPRGSSGGFGFGVRDGVWMVSSNPPPLHPPTTHDTPNPHANDSCDVLVTSGGVSMGEADLLKPALLGMGATVHFGRLNMKPGKPTTFATMCVQSMKRKAQGSRTPDEQSHQYASRNQQRRRRHHQEEARLRASGEPRLLPRLLPPPRRPRAPPPQGPHAGRGAARAGAVPFARWGPPLVFSFHIYIHSIQTNQIDTCL